MTKNQQQFEEEKSNLKKQYRCFCAKSYSSYAGLYLHLKSKHQDAFSKYKNMKISKLLNHVKSQQGKQIFKLKEPQKQENEKKSKIPESKENRIDKQQRQDRIENPKEIQVRQPNSSMQNVGFPLSGLYQNNPYQFPFLQTNVIPTNQVGQYRIGGYGPGMIQKYSLHNAQYQYPINQFRQMNMMNFPQNYNVNGFISNNPLQFSSNTIPYHPITFQNFKNQQNSYGYLQPTNNIYRNQQFYQKQQQKHAEKSGIQQKQSKNNQNQQFYNHEQYMKKIIQSTGTQQSIGTRFDSNNNSI